MEVGQEDLHKRACHWTALGFWRSVHTQRLCLSPVGDSSPSLAQDVHSRVASSATPCPKLLTPWTGSLAGHQIHNPIRLVMGGY